MGQAVVVLKKGEGRTLKAGRYVGSMTMRSHR